MLPTIDYESGRDLLSFLSGEYCVSLCDGKVDLYCTALPADTVSAACQTRDGKLHVFIDLDKPAAYAHGRQMMREWLGMEPDAIDRAVTAIIEGIPR